MNWSPGSETVILNHGTGDLDPKETSGSMLYIKLKDSKKKVFFFYFYYLFDHTFFLITAKMSRYDADSDSDPKVRIAKGRGSGSVRNIYGSGTQLKLITQLPVPGTAGRLL
jgi:hypothetical protein